MGAVCSRRRRVKIIHDNYTQTEDPIPNTLPYRQNTKTQYSSISHEHTNRSSNHYVPSQRQRYSTCPPPINIPSSFYRRSNPHVRSRVPVDSSTNNIYRTESYEKFTRVSSSLAIDTEEQTYKQNVDDRSGILKRSVSTPIDMFLIDVSNEYVPIGQPVSINIRHLLLDASHDNHTNSTDPNLFKYIPYICEEYPNPTVSYDQPTHNTLYVSVPRALA